MTVPLALTAYPTVVLPAAAKPSSVAVVPELSVTHDCPRAHWSGGSTASGGHAPLVPLQTSAASQLLAAGRQTNPASTKVSAGQNGLAPSQLSAATSQAPATGLQTKPPGAIASAGQFTLVPSQVSGMSQPPTAARQTKPAGAKTSAGHAVLVPSHSSAGSQPPAAARHVCPAAAGARYQSTAAPAATLQARQSPATPPPQAVSQQTPSTQWALAHGPSVVHIPPLPTLVQQSAAQLSQLSRNGSQMPHRRWWSSPAGTCRRHPPGTRTNHRRRRRCARVFSRRTGLRNRAAERCRCPSTTPRRHASAHRCGWSPS